MVVKMPDREGAVAAARKEAPFVLTESQGSLAILLERVQDVDWASKNDVDLTRRSRASPAKTLCCFRLAVLRRPIVCSTCITCVKRLWTFRKCISAPGVVINDQRRSIIAGACANCVWRGKGAQCSFYVGENEGWDQEFDKYVFLLFRIVFIPG
ncbi:uncharacterized protein P174DRAFT_360922 [Aspergillus novofumigatus IBT 16806]|uniref:Uncharacterized protein n=1 Tax=Aspergillus novofumigatus (strain IBT 16806) TaxID=1392255 RepID=A0A2I1CL73_ASPN1|nr:uncharacterized protein P174DRAFT_360922 [Aspergillus novofumigatus IBT 16806]PKX98346.1 hypothetical protein P174DRAFT_360922 [Aspergillus novofumigatus IBT 16806]